MEDVPLILTFIRELADYERLSHEVLATEGSLREWLFGVAMDDWTVHRVTGEALKRLAGGHLNNG